MKYTFSGHESFACKGLWLKKGYDFIMAKNDFNAPDSVIELGVGKNMVSSIRYWMKAFGLTTNDKLNPIASYLLENESGKDPFLEDLGTLWLLHFLLISSQEATLYNLVFTKLQRERKIFDKQSVINLVKRTMIEDGKQSLFNENTVKKDLNVLLQSYILPSRTISFEEYSSLLLDLSLIRESSLEKQYTFNTEGKRTVPWQIFLFAIVTLRGKDNTVNFDVLQDTGLIFCMNDMEVIEMCKEIESHHSHDVRYSDIAGIRQIQFINSISPMSILNEYYNE